MNGIFFVIAILIDMKRLIPKLWHASIGLMIYLLAVGYISNASSTYLVLSIVGLSTNIFCALKLMRNT